MRNDKPMLPQRRQFLKGVVATGGGLALALQARPSAASTDDDTTPATPQGYRLTQHIQTYYQTLKV